MSHENGLLPSYRSVDVTRDTKYDDSSRKLRILRSSVLSLNNWECSSALFDGHVTPFARQRSDDDNGNDNGNDNRNDRFFETTAKI